MVTPRLPSVLAGEDNEVEMSADGAKRILELVTGTAVGAGILAAGGMLWQYIASRTGAEQNVSGLY